MNRLMTYEQDQEVQGRYENQTETEMKRASYDSIVQEAGDLSLTGRRDPRSGPAQRYERFEPITVRAAARVLQLQRSGVVSAKEAAFYLRELATMDAHAGKSPITVRAAQLRAAAGPVGARCLTRRGGWDHPRSSRPGESGLLEFEASVLA